MAFFFVPRATGRSTPMTGTDRSNLSCRTLLILFVLLGTPMAARSDTLEDSAKELARKIVAALPARDATSFHPRDDVSIELRNSSFLTPEELVRIDQALKAELQSMGIGPPANAGGTARVLVTLSENLKSYVWTAEMLQGETSQVALTTLPRPLENRVTSDAMVMTLHSDKFWEGADPIIDVTFVSLSKFEQRMVLLLADGLIITNAEKGAAFKKVEFPPWENISREPTGRVWQIGDQVESQLNERNCTVALETGTLVGCYVPRVLEGSSRGVVLGADKPKFGDQVREIPNNCGINNPMLATGTGDYTQPDSVQVIKDNSAISNRLSFPGPVLKFSQGPDTQFVTAIVRNLKDGNYAVYRLSISCGQ